MFQARPRSPVPRHDEAILLRRVGSARQHIIIVAGSWQLAPWPDSCFCRLIGLLSFFAEAAERQRGRRETRPRECLRQIRSAFAAPLTISNFSSYHNMVNVLTVH